LGDNVALTGEGRSTATLELQGGQLELWRRMVELGKQVVVVLINGKPLVLPHALDKTSALIEAFNPGDMGGQAIAELIFGDIEPSGRLPISFPVHAGQQPIFYNQIRGQHGNRYADLTQEPAFAFGQGLSYSRVEYSDLQLETATVGVDGTIRASVRVANTGDRVLTETVQWYVRDLVTSATWADKELKGFQKVALESGESAAVSCDLAASSCSIVDSASVRVVEPGDFELLVGPDSRNASLLTARFTVVA
ncbi:MAG TPA: glycoside hydrolase family 3 C-terminal domain-containing protein, partial [Propionibacteriaceae bacterium]